MYWSSAEQRCHGTYQATYCLKVYFCLRYSALHFFLVFSRTQMPRQALAHAHCQLVRCGDISVEAGEGRERERGREAGWQKGRERRGERDGKGGVGRGRREEGSVWPKCRLWMAAEPSLKCGTCEFNRVSRRGWHSGAIRWAQQKLPKSAKTRTYC